MNLPKFVKKPQSKAKTERAKTNKSAPAPKKRIPAADELTDDSSECPVCGKKVSAKDLRCNVCGTEFEPEDDQSGWDTPKAGDGPPKGGLVVMDTELSDCPVCGATVSIDATRCPKCGTEFEVEAPGEVSGLPEQGATRVSETAAESEEDAECPICGSVSNVANKSCPFCGAEFEPVGLAKETTNALLAVSSPSAQEVDESVSCPVCGEAVGTSVQVCPRCGAEFEPEEEVPKPPAVGPVTGVTAIEDEVSCPVCGNSVGLLVPVCPHCGTEFETEETTQATALSWSGPSKAKAVAPGILRPPVGRRRGDSRRGISNGASAINGVSLVNGLGQATAPSRINGTGATNGMDLVNGRGLSNGGAVNGRRQVTRGRRNLLLRRWQLMAIVVACVLVIPAVYFTTLGRDEPPFSVNGEFDDWDDEARFTTTTSAFSPTIDVTEWSVATHSRAIYLYVETEAPMMASETVEGFILFIDADGSVETGYNLAEIGADAMIEILGWNQSVSKSTCYVFGSSDDRLDWNAWTPRCGVTCFLDGSQLEASAELFADLGDASKVLLTSIDEDGPGCRSHPVPVVGGMLVVEQTPSVDITSDGILEPGSEVLVSTLKFSCLRAGGDVLSVSPELIGIDLLGSVEPFSLELGEEVEVDLLSDASSIPSGQFVSAFVTSEGIQSSFSQVSVVGGGARAYVDIPPESVAIDGAFADWIGRTATDVDSDIVTNPNIDIDDVGGANDTDNSYVFVSVRGEIFAGDYAPVTCSRPTAAGNGTVVPVRRTGEDFMKIYIDCDKSSATGFTVNAGSSVVGAERLIEISGLCGEIKEATLSVYVDGYWADTEAWIDVEARESAIELGLDSTDVGGDGDFDFLVITTDWRRAEDLALFFSDYDVSGGRSLDEMEVIAAYPWPTTESLPEFGDMAMPVIFVLVIFIVLARRRRQ